MWTIDNGKETKTNLSHVSLKKKNWVIGRILNCLFIVNKRNDCDVLKKLWNLFMVGLNYEKLKNSTNYNA